MQPALLVRLKPATPWRIGAGPSGPSEAVFHSDSLYSAVCSAFWQLGQLEEWLAATAQAEAPAVALGSCFPFSGNTLFAPPPAHLWPPADNARLRWKGARLVPLEAIAALAAGEALAEDAFVIDAPSRCLLPVDRRGAGAGPFRLATRSSAAVDRLSGAVAPHSTGFVQFSPQAGLWFAAVFASEDSAARWTAPLTAALRLLADSGFGGLRSRGFGRAEEPEIRAGTLPELLGFPAATGGGWWLLSLFSPAGADQVDWSRGAYSLTRREGRVESTAGWGREKKSLNMVAEGSVLVSAEAPRGAALDVAPAGFPHPVWRAGFAVALPVAWPVPL